MNKAQIARAHKVEPIFVTWLERGERYTIKRKLALDMARLTGKKPIDFIHPDRRVEFLEDHPELDKKIKKAV